MHTYINTHIIYNFICSANETFTLIMNLLKF